MKMFLAMLLVLASIIGAAIFWLSGNMDYLIKTAIDDYGSAMTQVKVSVGNVKIAAADGKGTIGNLLIGNPAGFKTAYAMKVGQIDVDIDIASVAINAPDLIYEKGDSMTNFDAIQKNIARYVGPAEKEGKKLIVEELTIRDARAQASAAFLKGKTVTMPLPDITMKNLGKAKGGISPGELGQEIAGALKAKLTAAVRFDRLMKSTGEVLEKVGATVKGLFK